MTILGKACAEINPSFKSIINDCKELNRYIEYAEFNSPVNFYSTDSLVAIEKTQHILDIVDSNIFKFLNVEDVDDIILNFRGRQRKVPEERKSLIKQLLASYKPEDASDVQSMLKDLLGDTLQEMLETELDEDLGYSKYDYANKETDNRRNGFSKKTVTSSMGDL